ncbi:MAG TPA: hypothetical protein VHA52_09650 [Candidatus Babeliaceae bacterium]|nr:hypothetical protein [Candidatus Babeliaceae bacterium]
MKRIGIICLLLLFTKSSQAMDAQGQENKKTHKHHRHTRKEIKLMKNRIIGELGVVSGGQDILITQIKELKEQVQKQNELIKLLTERVDASVLKSKTLQDTQMSKQLPPRSLPQYPKIVHMSDKGQTVSQQSDQPDRLKLALKYFQADVKKHTNT